MSFRWNSNDDATEAQRMRRKMELRARAWVSLRTHGGSYVDAMRASLDANDLDLHGAIDDLRRADIVARRLCTACSMRRRNPVTNLCDACESACTEEDDELL